MAIFTFLVTSCGVLFVVPLITIILLMIRWFAQVIYQSLRYTLPPGPVGVPVLGCLPKVDTSVPLHYILTDMAESYGDIFSMRLGDKLAVIVSSLESMKATIVLQGKKFSGRPRFATFKETKGGFDKGLSLRDMCQDYNKNKKLVHHGFKNLFSAHGQMQKILPDECQKLVTYLKKIGPVPFNPLSVFRKASASMFLRVTFGDNFDYDDKELQRFVSVMEEWFEIAESNNPADYITLLECLPNERLKKAKKITDNFDDFCKQRLLRKWEGKSECQGYFSSSFVQEMVEISKQLSETGRGHEEQNIVECVASRYASVITDMIGGGFDTVPNTLGWTMLYLNDNQEALSNLKAEIRSVSENKIENLLSTSTSPYLAASVYEAIRHSTVAPLALPHSTIEDVKVFDYMLPKDSLVLVNLWAINHSEDIWSDPHSFDPSRYLINNNEFDIKKTRSVYSFSSGVRRCPGEKLAILEMQAFVGTILQNFDFTVSTAPKDMKSIKGLTSKPKPYEILLTSRV